MKRIALLIALFNFIFINVCFSQDAHSSDALKQKALDHCSREDYLQAEDLYRKILLENPSDVDAYVSRGYCRLKDKIKHREALADFEQAISLADDYVDAYVGKAILYKRRGHWTQAKVALQDCQHALSDNIEGLKYLAQKYWELGFHDLARALDKQYPPDPHRKLLDFENEASLSYGHDWLDGRPDWWETHFTYTRRLRPDKTTNIFYSHFDRDQDEDFLVGLGYGYKLNYQLSLSYEGYFSDHEGFAARQKHRPTLDYRLPFSSTISMGANFDKFDNDWSKVGRLETTKYIGEYYGKYKILAGEDNNSEAVVTHIAELGIEKEGKYTFRLGYATGNESIEKVDRVISSDIDIDSYFASFRYFISPKWGMIFSGAREYRDGEFYRTTGTVAMFNRF